LGACAESPIDELNQPDSEPQTSAVATAAPEPAAPELVLSGEIAADGNRTARVFPLVGGQVVRVGAELGDEVRQGQVLAVLKSNEIADLQNQHTAGTADLAVARKNLSVAEELYQAGLAAEQDVYKARTEVARATGNDTRNQRQLGVYSIAKSGLNELRAPLAGYVIEKNLAPGLRFTTANMQTAFTVANLDSVWVMANVFEADLDRVHKGQALEITTLSYPDKPLRGRIDKVFHVLDHDSKVMKVRCTLPNPGHQLKPGMHAQVRVLTETNQ
jgi:cobalt-zinc-cadmium efflux system membrane fusion protein